MQKENAHHAGSKRAQRTTESPGKRLHSRHLVCPGSGAAHHAGEGNLPRGVTAA